MEHEQKPRRIIPAAEAGARTGLTRAQRYAEEKKQRFPARILITAHRVGYFEDEINAWIESRPRAGAAIITPRSPGRLGKQGAKAKVEAAP